MKVLLVLNKPNREIPIMESIKREILTLRPDAEVEIREMCVPSFHPFVLNYRPDVILTFPFTCVGFSMQYYLYKFLFHCRIFSLRAEGVVDYSSEYNIQGMTGFDVYGEYLVDYELFWGKQMSIVIGTNLVKQGKLSSLSRAVYFGYPRLESYSPVSQPDSPALPDRIRDVVQRYPKEKTVFFITGFHLADYTRQNLFDAKDLDAENKIDELLEAVEISKRYRSEWVETILKVARENKDLLFIVKKHPIEKQGDYPMFNSVDNILYVYEDVGIHEIMPWAGMFIHYGSSALVDAYLCEIPSIYVYSPENKQWYQDLGWPSSIRATLADIPSLIADFKDRRLAIQTITKEIDAILKEVFNFERGRPYHPSRDIAAFIVRDEPAQRIPLTDRYLWKSLFFLSLRRMRSAVSRIIKMLLLKDPDEPLFKRSCSIHNKQD